MDRRKKQMRLEWLLASFAVGVCVLAVIGCSERRSGRMNAPPQGTSTERNDLQDNYITMHDNALLADMSMSSIHFVPHSVDLNGMGVSRLKRYVTVLKVYGGTLNYCGNEQDRPLTYARIESIKNYLVASGMAEDQFTVNEGMAGGSGMRASEAIAIRAGSTYCTKEEDGGSSDSGSSEALMSSLLGSE